MLPAGFPITKKNRHPLFCRGMTAIAMVWKCLFLYHIAGLFAFGTGLYFKFNLITIVKARVTIGLDFGMMDKKVVAIFS
jgi:hypothetical protein